MLGLVPNLFWEQNSVTEQAVKYFGFVDNLQKAVPLEPEGYKVR